MLTDWPREASLRREKQRTDLSEVREQAKLLPGRKMFQAKEIKKCKCLGIVRRPAWLELSDQGEEQMWLDRQPKSDEQNMKNMVWTLDLIVSIDWRLCLVDRREVGDSCFGFEKMALLCGKQNYGEKAKD